MNTTKVISFANVHSFIGIDSHLKNWKITILLDGLELKIFSMNPAQLEIIACLKKYYTDGFYNVVYEAGFCGF